MRIEPVGTINVFSAVSFESCACGDVPVAITVLVMLGETTRVGRRLKDCFFQPGDMMHKLTSTFYSPFPVCFFHSVSYGEVHQSVQREVCDMHLMSWFLVQRVVRRESMEVPQADARSHDYTAPDKIKIVRSSSSEIEPEMRKCLTCDLFLWKLVMPLRGFHFLQSFISLSFYVRKVIVGNC